MPLFSYLPNYIWHPSVANASESGCNIGDQLTGTDDRKLKIFTAREDGVEHVGADTMSFGRDLFAEKLGGHTA